MSADPIDDLAERLFASARREGASERLVQRVLTDVAKADERRWPISLRASGARSRATRPLARVVLAAAACVMGAVAWSTLEPPREAPRISAEVGPRGDRGPRSAKNIDTSATPAPAPAPALAVTPSATEPESVPHAETPRAPGEPSATPRRPASRRPPRTTQSQATATPPAPAEAVPVSPAPGTTGALAPDLPGATDTPAAPPSLSDELQALERARAALRGGDGRAALRLLDENGTAGFTRLAAEATLLRIEALYAVGELAESRRLADEFTTRNPDSHLGDRARSFIRRIDASRDATGGRAPR